MTMRNPLIDVERNTPIAKTFDPAKRYRYTWPGYPSKTVGGAELTSLVAGADVSLLGIEEVGGGHPEILPSAVEEHARDARDRGR